MNKNITLHSFYIPNEDCTPYIVKLFPGKYLFELWGASGGGGEYAGKGAYVCGLITLNITTKFYINVGGKGDEPIKSGLAVAGGCNGGGKGGTTIDKYYSGGGGGGGSDIRTSKDEYESRIIVAGGGGGGVSKEGKANGGDAGNLSGYDSQGFIQSLGGGKTNCKSYFQGKNGREGTDTSYGGEGGGGGGGGWYGGCASNNSGENTNSGGGGGSSYISGHPSFKIKNEKYQFTSYYILDGKQKMLSPEGIEEEGHSGDGFIRISGFTFYQNQTCNHKNKSKTFSLFLFIILLFPKNNL